MIEYHQRTHLASQMPAMFGFSVFDSLYDAGNGRIPFASDKEEMVGGHAVMAVGYDDALSDWRVLQKQEWIDTGQFKT